MHRSFVRLLGVCVASSVLVSGCASDGSSDDERDESDQTAGRAPRIGAYFMEGTDMTAANNGIIYRLSKKTAGSAVVARSRYFQGPSILCTGDSKDWLSCPNRTETLVRSICDDFKANRIDAFVVFGYSRGAFIANKAAQLVKTRCESDAKKYLYGGFLDGVQMSWYLSEDSRVPKYTKWHHVHRKDTDSWIYPVTKFWGYRVNGELNGVNEVGPDTDHPGMGINPDMLTKMAKEANRRSGYKIFPGY